MPTYVIYADREHKRRSDGCNTIIASADDAEAAVAVAERLLGENPGKLADFVVVDLASAPAFAVQGLPIGARWQSALPTVGRGGDSLRGA